MHGQLQENKQTSRSPFMASHYDMEILGFKTHTKLVFLSKLLGSILSFLTYSCVSHITLSTALGTARQGRHVSSTLSNLYWQFHSEDQTIFLMPQKPRLAKQTKPNLADETSFYPSDSVPSNSQYFFTQQLPSQLTGKAPWLDCPSPRTKF